MATFHPDTSKMQIKRYLAQTVIALSVESVLKEEIL
jgi:hypothetical protein